MRSSYTLSTYAAVALSALPLARAASWSLTETYNPNDFLSTSKWDYWTEADPTHGLITYQSAANAKSLNLTGVSNDEFYMRVDTTQQQLAGRPSVRIQSVANYSDGVYVIDASHFPVGCAVWPAFWTVVADTTTWPVGGEIDIMENANDEYDSNLVSLHTKSACTIPSNSDQTGKLAYSVCNSDEGCRVEMNGTTGAQAASTGSAFNSAGGGLFAMERSLGTTGNGIRVWFFPRGSEPDDLKSGSTSVDTSGWGTPGADFPIASQCGSQFTAHKIVLNTALCGDWAANTFTESGCAAKYNSCSYIVGYQGDQFEDAYWRVGSVRVFATGGSTDNAANSSKQQSSESSSSSTSGALRSLPVASVFASVAAVAAWTIIA